MKPISSLFFLSLLLFNLNACKERKTQQTEVIETPAKEEMINPVYIGTYTKKEGFVDGKANGIYLMNKKTDGALEMVMTVAEITNPSYVIISKDGNNLYAVSELGEGDSDSGFIYAYKINDDYSLTELGKLSTEGFAPCHINIDNTDTFVFVSNYVGGIVMEYKRNDDGSLTKIAKLELNEINPLENTGNSHAHAVTIPENNQFIYISDLGNDKIWIYDFDQDTGLLTPNQQPFVELTKGAGPRHFEFAPSQKYAYSINELNSTVTTFSYDSISGKLNNLQTISTLPENYEGNNSCAEIAVHPNGKFLYASNRGHNSIAAFEMDQNTGKLQTINHQSTQGDFPRFFTLNENGTMIYVANQNTSTISFLKIQENGSLSASYLDPVEVKTPVCIDFYRF
jgi:6-phosphogluconolactonase